MRGEQKYQIFIFVGLVFELEQDPFHGVSFTYICKDRERVAFYKKVVNYQPKNKRIQNSGTKLNTYIYYLLMLY